MIFVEDMKLVEGKTKELDFRFKKMGWDKALLVDETSQDQFQRACRNLKNFKYLRTEGLNVYDVLKYDRVVFDSSIIRDSL